MPQPLVLRLRRLREQQEALRRAFNLEGVHDAVLGVVLDVDHRRVGEVGDAVYLRGVYVCVGMRRGTTVEDVLIETD